MDIIGNGMVARAFTPYHHNNALDDVVIFASGVSDSSTTDDAEYRREQTLLYATLQQCAVADQRLVYFSSGGAIYGPTDHPRDERTPTYPTTRYGQQQLLCEGVIVNSGVRYLIVRLPNLVGPSQHHAQLIPALVNHALSGEATLFTNATRDLLDVDDCARLVVALLRNVPTDEIVTVASGVSCPIQAIFTIICDVLTVQPQVTHISKGDQQRFDISKMRGFLKERVQFDDTYPKQLIHKYLPSLVK